MTAAMSARSALMNPGAMRTVPFIEAQASRQFVIHRNIRPVSLTAIR